jgi:uncharacterized protein YjiS (DUF1127 family)
MSTMEFDWGRRSGHGDLAVLDRLKAWQAERKRRRSMRALSELDDHILKDIGFRREAVGRYGTARGSTLAIPLRTL